MAASDWTLIDSELFGDRVMSALVTYRESTGAGVAEAIAAISERIQHLKLTARDQFTVPPEVVGRRLIS